MEGVWSYCLNVEDFPKLLYATMQKLAIKDYLNIEALKEEEDHHTQQLKDAYLFTRAKRRIFAMEGQEPVILEGITIYPQKGKITNAPEQSHPIR